MNWGSFSAFVDMGGNGLYVWGSYAVMAACLAIEPWLIARRRRRALREAAQAEIWDDEPPR